MGYYVYKIVNKMGEVEYIGKTTDLQKRIYQHICAEGGKLKDETLSRFWGITFTEFESQCDMDLVELYLIAKLKPKKNVSCLGINHKLSFELDVSHLVWINVPMPLFSRRVVTTIADDLYFQSYGFRKHETLKDFPIYYYADMPAISIHQEGDFYYLTLQPYTSLEGFPRSYIAKNAEKTVSLEDVRHIGIELKDDTDEFKQDPTYDELMEAAQGLALEAEVPTCSGAMYLLIKSVLNSCVNKNNVSLVEVS